MNQKEETRNTICHAELVSESLSRSYLHSKVDKTLNKAKLTKIRRIAAFTLSETLITLAILGVVATVILSNAIKHYQRKVTVTKVKKVYSLLVNAYDMYFIENRDPYYVLSIGAGTGIKPYSEVGYEKYIKPYIKINYIAGNDTKKQSNILYNGKYKYLSDNLTPNINPVAQVRYAVQLSDGGVFSITGNTTEINSNSAYMVIMYDVNGKKKPNTFGRDTFLFTFSKNGVYSTGSSDMKENSKNYCIGTNSWGTGCSDWIIAKGNMNYLDCPGNADFETGKCK